MPPKCLHCDVYLQYVELAPRVFAKWCPCCGRLGDRVPAQAKSHAALREACEAMLAPCEESMIGGIMKLAHAADLARAALALDAGGT